MRAGRIRTRGTFQVRTEAADALGDPQGSSTWANVTNGTVWAQVSHLTGREAEIVHKIDATATHTVRVRYNSNLDSVGPKHRFRFTWNSVTKDLYIVARDDVDRRERETMFLCKEAA